MFWQRIQSEGLAHFSYYISDGGEAVVVDASRDVDRYVDLARQRNERIRFALETHRNEDYVVGSPALQRYGATVLHAGDQDFQYGHGVDDGDRFGVGQLEFRVLKTPGHTWDSLCFALADLRTSPQPFAVFTGDTLFAGDIGRTDLLGPDEQAALAPRLFESLEQLFSLGDGVVALPAHGEGSVCGAGISSRDLTTLGFEKKTNPLLQSSREEFVETKSKEQHLKPPYFRWMEEYNLLGNAPERLGVPRVLDVDDVKDFGPEDGLVVDTRGPEAFAGGHIPGSISLPLGILSAYLGWVAEPDQRLTFVLPESVDVDRVARMAYRIGYDQLAVLRGGFSGWRASGLPVGRVGTLDAVDFSDRSRMKDTQILDVRKPSEHAGGGPTGARSLFVGHLPQQSAEVPVGPETVTVCGVGTRGSLAASLLLRQGHRRVTNVLGGYTAIRKVSQGG